MSLLQDLDPDPSAITAILGIDISEDCDPANVNNAIRNLAALVVRNVLAAQGSYTSTGSANAHALATDLDWSAYEPQIIAMVAGYTNTGAATLNVDAIGAKSIVLRDGSALYKWAIRAGGVYLLTYNATADAFILLNPSPGPKTWNLVLRGTVLDGSQAFIQKAARPGKITNVTAIAGAGTGNLTIKINGTAIGGSANALSTSESDVDRSASNSYAAGDTISYTIDTASGLTSVAISVERQEE